MPAILAAAARMILTTALVLAAVTAVLWYATGAQDPWTAARLTAMSAAGVAVVVALGALPERKENHRE